MTEIQVLAQQSQDIDILYVEDEEDVREQTKMIFDMLFKNVDTAFDGLDAWQKYQNTHYDIIFTDISMPRMDGLELSRLIKEEDPMQKIVIVSAHNASDYLLQAIELGVEGFLLKPIAIEKMVLVVKKLVDSILAGKLMKNYRQKLEAEVEKKTEIIKKQAITDKLTGLQNRFALNKALEKLEDDSALLLINIDNFESINLVYGYPYGDKVIVALSKLLSQDMIEKSQLFYLGNDEFAILCNTSEDMLMRYAKDLQDRIAKSSVEYKREAITFTVTIAIAKNNDNLLKNAYVTLKEAKREGKNSIKRYSKDLLIEKLQAQIQEYSSIIREAIDEKNVVPYFQAIVDNRTNKIEKYECLARIVKGDKLYTPFLFISIAEQIGAIPEITKIMIDKSFKAFRHNSYGFSINITEIDLNNHYLQTYLEKKLQEYAIEPSRVVLEVLEGISATGAKNSLEQLIQLEEMGFKIAIDDFGAQNSNFERVHSMNVDFIKIDGSFVKNIAIDPKSYSIVKTITEFAKSIGAEVVAEYVHSKEVQEIIKELGIEYSQGYYFSEPKEELINEI
ncbi:EAL domain-containing protein [Hydrogenimonas sp.]